MPSRKRRQSTLENGLAMQVTPGEKLNVSKAQQGDEEAVTRLYETHVESIYAYVAYRVESVAAAEDLTSEVFIRMVRGLATYQDQGIPFRVWLFRIAANLITDHYRQQGKYRSVPLLEDYAADEVDSFERVDAEEEALNVRLALRALPEPYQDLLILRFVEDLPHAEIAQIMKKSTVALRAMQYRAIKALGEQLERLHKKRSSQWGTGR